jgi:hypothetical protein
MRTDQSVRNLIKGGLRPLSDVPQRDVERACDRVLERLQEQPCQATGGIDPLAPLKLTPLDH